MANYYDYSDAMRLLSYYKSELTPDEVLACDCVCASYVSNERTMCTHDQLTTVRRLSKERNLS